MNSTLIAIVNSADLSPKKLSISCLTHMRFYQNDKRLAFDSPEYIKIYNKLCL